MNTLRLTAVGLAGVGVIVPLFGGCGADGGSDTTTGDTSVDAAIDTSTPTLIKDAAPSPTKTDSAPIGPTCMTGQSVCSGACVDLTSNGANCGTCGTACTGGLACSAGKCAATCGTGTMMCGTSCVDEQVDPTNCGGCGTTCQKGYACSGGHCGLTCETGYTSCGGDGGATAAYCADTTSDSRNCNGCGIVCGAGTSCTSSACSCPATWLSCAVDGGAEGGSDGGVACADPLTNSDNCGSCGNPCLAGKVCSNGSCQTSCALPLITCNDACKDPTYDPTNCGSCGVTCANAPNVGDTFCSGRTCVVATCAPGYADCDGNPTNGCEVNVAVDAANCGACGVALTAGQTCCGGERVTFSGVNDGSLVAATDNFYQYAPITAGAGFVRANWPAVPGATAYSIAIGTTAGASDIAAATSIGNVTSASVASLSLQGAWVGASPQAYFATVTASCVGGNTVTASSNGVRIAEAASWDGSLTGLRAVDAKGGFTASWPESGVDAVYGTHYFEAVAIAAATTVRVQGWGKVDAVPEGIAASDPKVTSPSDGWLELQANTISLAGVITASGRGYGGGGGGGATCGAAAPRGHGGALGIGGNGGLGTSTGCSGGGSGGGGSPEGSGAFGNCSQGGTGNLFGGGGGGSGQYGCGGAVGNGANGGVAGNGGAAGAIGDIGGAGLSIAASTAATGGVGEFLLGGGGGSGNPSNSRGGGGGGGYGGGGGGGNESWASGGGGGGTGGSGGGNGDNGLAGAGPFGGAGSATANPAPAGTFGGYGAAGANGDATTDRSLRLGSGGGGGAGSESQAGGGGGAAGGGYIKLTGKTSVLLATGARLLANGAGGGGGSDDDNDGTRIGGQGGAGAGGGLLLEGATVTIGTTGNNLSARGGGGSLANGGTIKLYYTTLLGTTPTAAGRIFSGIFTP